MGRPVWVWQKAVLGVILVWFYPDDLTLLILLDRILVKSWYYSYRFSCVLVDSAYIRLRVSIIIQVIQPVLLQE